MLINRRIKNRSKKKKKRERNRNWDFEMWLVNTDCVTIIDKQRTIHSVTESGYINQQLHDWPCFNTRERGRASM